MFNDKLIGMMKRGSYIVNTARGKICDRDAIVRALESGQLAGYAGDVWFPQPAPRDDPWRTMPHHGMTPHISGSSLSAQSRYAAGTREILESYFAKKPIRTEYLIVDKGKLAGTGARSYTAGDATKGLRKREQERTLTRPPVRRTPPSLRQTPARHQAHARCEVSPGVLRLQLSRKTVPQIEDGKAISGNDPWALSGCCRGKRSYRPARQSPDYCAAGL